MSKEATKCCGNCARFFPDSENPRVGWCDEWPFRRSADCVCHPYIGRPKRKAKREEAAK